MIRLSKFMYVMDIEKEKISLMGSYYYKMYLATSATRWMMH